MGIQTDGLRSGSRFNERPRRTFVRFPRAILETSLPWVPTTINQSDLLCQQHDRHEWISRKRDSPVADLPARQPL
jgi:hypothetical protein